MFSYRITPSLTTRRIAVYVRRQFDAYPRHTTMLKLICDLAQILLDSGAWGALALALLLLQSGKVLRLAWAEARRWVLRMHGWGLVWNALLTGGLFLLFASFAPQISDGIQWFEQTLVSPVHFAEMEADTSSAAAEAYTRKLQRSLVPADYAMFLRRTAEIAAKCGSTPLSFYEVYESECSCNPFAVNSRDIFDRYGKYLRTDTVAAGPIQFTAVGVSGLVMDGEPVTMRKVKDAIIARRLAWLMDLQEMYMARAAGGRPLPRPCDVYTAVFMPSFVGGSMETVLASKWGDKPQYYWQNIGLDGWQLSPSGKVLHLDSARDGKITIQDLALCLAAKKAAVCGAHKKE